MKNFAGLHLSRLDGIQVGNFLQNRSIRRLARLFDGCFGSGSSVAVFGGMLVSPEQLNEFCEKFEPIYEGWLAEK